MLEAFVVRLLRGGTRQVWARAPERLRMLGIVHEIIWAVTRVLLERWLGKRWYTRSPEASRHLARGVLGRLAHLVDLLEVAIIS